MYFDDCIKHFWKCQHSLFPPILHHRLQLVEVPNHERGVVTRTEICSAEQKCSSKKHTYLPRWLGGASIGSSSIPLHLLFKSLNRGNRHNYWREQQSSRYRNVFGIPSWCNNLVTTITVLHANHLRAGGELGSENRVNGFERATWHGAGPGGNWRHSSSPSGEACRLAKHAVKLRPLACFGKASARSLRVASLSSREDCAFALQKASRIPLVRWDIVSLDAQLLGEGEGAFC